MEKIREKFGGFTIENYRKRKGSNLVGSSAKRIKMLGFTITNENFNPDTKLYTYTGHFTRETLNSFINEFKNSSGMRRETSGEVFILKGDINRRHVGNRRQVLSVPSVQASYHVHPSSISMMNIPDVFSLPSRDDIYYYLVSFPDIQINFIFDTNGVFIIDITESLIDQNGFIKFRREDVLDKYMKYVESLEPTINLEGFPYYTGVDIKKILKDLEVVTGGVKIQYIKYNENISDVTVDINTVNAL